MSRPDLPAAPPTAPASSSTTRTALITALAVALVVVALAVSAWARTNNQLAREHDNASSLARQRDSQTARAEELQSELDAAIEETAQLRTEQATQAEQIDRLQGQIRQLKKVVRGAVNLSGSYTALSDCLDAILAAYNSITYQVQWYDAYTNVASGPQCEDVIVTTPK